MRIGQIYHEDRIEDVDFSPDSKSILTASWDGTARVWDVASLDGTARVSDVASLTERYPPLAGHDGRVNAAAFRPPDGGQIATSGEDGKLLLWDFASGALVVNPKPYKFPYEILSLEFSGNGQKIILGSRMVAATSSTLFRMKLSL